MQKIISLSLVFLLFLGNVSFSFAEEYSCEYTSEIEQCSEENVSGNPLGIDPETDFLCIDSQNAEQRVYNIILDKEFKKTDKKINEYLDWLQKNKNYYFGAERKKVFFKAIDEIEDDFSIYGKYWNEYSKICDGSNQEGILQKTISCLGGSSSISNAKDYFSYSTCISLANAKLLVYKTTAYDVLELNKQAVRKDEKKLYFQKERSKFERVIDLFVTNLGYILRLSQKWASKTKNPY